MADATIKRDGKFRVDMADGGTTMFFMKALRADSRCVGLTLLELLVVIAVMAVMAAVFIMPPAGDRGRKSIRVRCLSKLMNLDMHFLMYACDNAGRFPMQVPAQDGGTMEFRYTRHVFPHFQILPAGHRWPQLVDVLTCPSDKTRVAATNINALTDLNISYFVNVDCSTNAPSLSLLMGDRNLTSNDVPVSAGALVVTTNVNVNWSAEMHRHGGNLAFADGHAEWCKTNGLNAVIARQPFATSQLCIP